MTTIDAGTFASTASHAKGGVTEELTSNMKLHLIRVLAGSLTHNTGQRTHNTGRHYRISTTVIMSRRRISSRSGIQVRRGMRTGPIVSTRATSHTHKRISATISRAKVQSNPHVHITSRTSMDSHSSRMAMDHHRSRTATMGNSHTHINTTSTRRHSALA
jgi:hypothetical protein